MVSETRTTKGCSCLIIDAAPEGKAAELRTAPTTHYAPER
jgi:hypothetical protein